MSSFSASLRRTIEITSKTNEGWGTTVVFTRVCQTSSHEDDKFMCFNISEKSIWPELEELD